MKTKIQSVQKTMKRTYQAPELEVIPIVDRTELLASTNATSPGTGGGSDFEEVAPRLDEDFDENIKILKSHVDTYKDRRVNMDYEK